MQMYLCLGLRADALLPLGDGAGQRVERVRRGGGRCPRVAGRRGALLRTHFGDRLRVLTLHFTFAFFPCLQFVPFCWSSERSDHEKQIYKDSHYDKPIGFYDNIIFFN